jgi:short-subunit dehydrogenase
MAELKSIENVGAPLIEAKESDFEFLFDVNVFGVFRVTQAFAPIIIESKGRIVNVSSISGALSGGGYGMYAGSKHALEAITDALAIEKALFEENPRDRYLVVPRQVEAGWTVAKAVEEMLALNVGHEYGYSRDEVIRLIDALWPFASGAKSWDDAADEAEMRAFMTAWMEKQAASEE